MNYTYGYVRISTDSQSMATQLDSLSREQCHRIFQEQVTGRRTSSPALDELLSLVRPGDTIVVSRFVRLGRNALHTIGLVKWCDEQGVFLRALDLGVDTRTPSGKMVAGIFALLGEYDLENNREKSLHGIRLAKEAGKHLGRPAGRDAEKVAKVKMALEKGLSVPEIVELTGISQSSVKRYRQELTS